MAEPEMLGRVPLLQLSDVADHRQPAARHLRQSLISGYTQLVSFVIASSAATHEREAEQCSQRCVRMDGTVG